MVFSVTSMVLNVVGKHPALIVALSLIALASFGCSKQSKEEAPTKDQILSRADDALAAGQYIKAEKDYREVLRVTPNDARALRQLGALYLTQGQVIQAYGPLKKATELQPDDPELQLKFGEAAMALRQLPEARQVALEVLDKKPGDETALRLLVDTAVTPDEIQETQTAIDRLREKDRDRASYHIALGILELRQQNEAGAEKEIKAALELDPKSSRAYSALGRLYLSRNDLKAAEEAMKTAADLSPLQSPMQLAYLDFELRRGNLREAKDLLERINNKFPEYLPARVYRMKTVCAERLDDDCAKRVQEILAQDPINFDAHFQDSVLDLIKGNTVNAIMKLEFLSDKYRDKPELMYQLALAYLASAGHTSPVQARQAVDKAAGRLREAIKLNPHYAAAIMTYAELQIRSGNAASVIDSLVQLIKEQPQIADGYFLLTAAYRAEHKEDQALALLRQMTTVFPKDPRPPFSAGNILLALGQPADARREFERSLEITPDYPPAIEALVNLDIADKQYAAAMDRVQKLIDKNAESAPSWALRARIYLAQKDYSHAEADLLNAIALDPKLESAYLQLADLYVNSARQDQAIEKLSGFVAKNQSVPALTQLAKIYQQVENFPAAADTYRKLLAVSADNIPALNNLAVLYSEHLGQLDTAYDLAKRARELSPDDAHVADTLGWILFKRGDYGKALPLLQESTVKTPDAPEYQFHLGMAHYMLGEEAAARVALQRATDTGVDFPGKGEARQRLSVLAIDGTAANAAARTDLQNDLRQWPNDPAVLVRLAQFQVRDGNADQAVKTLEKIVADSPQYGPAMRQLAVLYGERGVDDPKAYDLVQKARQSYPDDADITKTLGILSYRRQFYPQSAELLKEAARTRKDDPELFYYLGAARQKLKQWNECKTALERALSLNLPSELAGKAQQALAECSEELATP
jgi:tetratricopeptide (TPR) repeat protein